MPEEPTWHYLPNITCPIPLLKRPVNRCPLGYALRTLVAVPYLRTSLSCQWAMSCTVLRLASYFFGKYSRVWIVVLGTVGLPLKDPFDLSQISRQINHLHEWQWSWHAYCIDSITQICWIKSTKSSRLYTSQLDNFDQCCSHRNALFNIIPLMRTGCREASYHKGWMRIPLIIMPIPQGGRLSGAPLWALTISRRKNYFSDWKEEWIMLGI